MAAQLNFGFICLVLALLWGASASPYGSAPRRYNTTAGLSIPVDLSSYFNNKGFSLYPGEGAFNTANESYPAENLPTGGVYKSTKTGVSYYFPGYQGLGGGDNVLCSGQVIPVTPGSYFSVHLLVAGDLAWYAGAGNLTFTYTDNSTSIAEMRSEPFYSFLTIFKGEIVMPSYFTRNDTNFNNTHIFEHISALDSTKTLASVTLPNTTYSASASRLHVFSMSIWKGSGIEVQYVRPTQKHSGDRMQLIEVLVNNAGSEWISGAGVEITISAPGVVTVQPGSIKRLRPGDQKKVLIGVFGCGNVTTQVKISGVIDALQNFHDISFGLEDYTTDLSSLERHESPDWFDSAKFGIFIHWGPFAVPSWGNSTPNEVYAEWYWWYGHHRAGDTKADVYDYHLRTYGPDVVYDDFFPNLTASAFNAKEWVDLFAEAGAQYMVFTTKHHDGFTMFNPGETTNRSALYYGPKRDILGELFEAAKTYQPHLHRGTYFSLPEWYNPDFGPYGFAQLPGNASTSWPGILANNPYTGAVEPYTGRVEIDDFIEDLMIPQMETLAYTYETDIMWCDCGAANASALFASEWFNWAASQGRQVTMNSRCGIAQGSDFDTPEYTTFSSVSQRKWESNQGMDPFSYGYNRATKPDAYMNASTIVNNLVDMVSKNGNFLLDVGPKADGSIDDTEVQHLKKAGIWIHANAEAIFNTTYWFITPEIGDIRFTQTKDAFYILSLSPLTSNFLVSLPLPILKGDTVSMIGAGNGSVLEWDFLSSGSGINVTVPEHLITVGKYCWVLKISYIA